MLGCSYQLIFALCIQYLCMFSCSLLPTLYTVGCQLSRSKYSQSHKCKWSHGNLGLLSKREYIVRIVRPCINWKGLPIHFSIRPLRKRKFVDDCCCALYNARGECKFRIYLVEKTSFFAPLLCWLFARKPQWSIRNQIVPHSIVFSKGKASYSYHSKCKYMNETYYTQFQSVNKQVNGGH